MDFIADWRDKGLLNPDQARLLSDIETGRLFSVSAELRALLYLGALLIVAGVGGTVKKYVLELGPLSIIAGLGLAVAWCYGYCFRKGLPYSDAVVESPTAGFDYILYMGCAFLGILFGYIEAHYHWLDKSWDYYLLASSALFFFLAYRFDNRLVLAMALVNLGAWFGFRFSHYDLPFFGLRVRGLAFGSLVVLAGWWLENSAKIKAHFADTYYNVGLHALFWALLWGLAYKGFWSAYFVALGILAAVAIAYSLRRRSFQYFLYGTVYGYIGLSYALIRDLFPDMASLGFVSLYFLVSSVALLSLIFRFRKQLRQDS